MGQFGLADWAEVSDGAEWPVLLAGNGASRPVSPVFDYGSLFEAANLSDNDRGVFDELSTVNFEEVLRSLDIAAFISLQEGHDTDSIAQRHEAVRNALVRAVNDHHVPWNDVQGPR